MLYVTEATAHWIMAAYFAIVLVLAVAGWRES